MWESVMSLFGVFQIVGRDRDDAYISLIEVGVMLFELAQLDHADPSPVTAVKDQDSVLSFLQTLGRKETAVGELGGKGRQLVTRLRRACIGFQSAAQHDEPVEAG